MPVYTAKAWYKDLGVWASITTILSGWLASPEIAGFVSQRVLSLLISAIGVTTLIIRTISTARPVGMSDGSRSVTVRRLEKPKPVATSTPPA